MAGQVRQISDTSEGRGADDQNDQNVTSANEERTSSDSSTDIVTSKDLDNFISIG